MRQVRRTTVTHFSRRFRLTFAALWLTAIAPAPPTVWAGDGLAAIDAFHVGRLHLANGKHEQALEAFNDSLRLNPQFVQAYLARGKLLAEMGRHSSALADLNFALHMQPAHAEGFAYRGYALLSTNRPEEALADFDQALQLDPSYARVHFLRGQTLHVVGRHADAEAETKTALQLDPTIATVRIAAAADTADGFSVVQAAPTVPERTSVMMSGVVPTSKSTSRAAGNVIRFDRHPSLAGLAPPAVSQPQVRESSPPPSSRSREVKAAARPLPTMPRAASVMPPTDLDPSSNVDPLHEPEQVAVVVLPAVESASLPPITLPQPIVVETDPTIVSDEPPSAGGLLAGVGTRPVLVDKPSPEVSVQKIDAALAEAKQAVTEYKRTAVAADSQPAEAPSAEAVQPPAMPMALAADDGEQSVPPAVAETANVASTPLLETPPSIAGSSTELAALDDLVSENPGDAELRCRRGLLRLEQTQFAAAAADFEEALKVDPARIEARYGRAKAKYLAGLLPEAIDAYADVLRHDDQHAAALIERGHCLAQLGRHAEAARDRDAALALNPSLAKTGPKYDVAPSPARAAVAGDAPAAVEQKAPSAEGRAKRRDAAVTAAVPMSNAEAAPDAVFIGDAATASSTALASAPAATPFEAAVRDLTDELQKTPGDARLYELRAQALLALGRAEDAVDDLTAAVRIDPASGKSLRLRSRAYQALGRTAEAEADRLQAEKITPASH